MAKWDSQHGHELGERGGTNQHARRHSGSRRSPMEAKGHRQATSCCASRCVRPAQHTVTEIETAHPNLTPLYFHTLALLTSVTQTQNIFEYKLEVRRQLPGPHGTMYDL